MSRACHQLHRRLAILTRYGVDFQDEALPSNGLYVMFQRGESAHETDRIVRVGTHRGDGHLVSRLHQHYHNQNKDRSIFRKHVGRALLSRTDDPFLEQWNWDLTTRKERERLSRQLDRTKLKATEGEVSAFLQENFTFTVLAAPTKSERLTTERALLATLATCRQCRPSAPWLGREHPNPMIKRTGLWNIQGLNGEPLSETEVNSMIEAMTPQVKP